MRDSLHYQLSEQAFQEALEKSAQKIHHLGLVEPVVFVLEAHKPLSAVAHAASLILQPVLSCLCGPASGAVLERLFESETRVDEFLQVLEKARSA